MAEKYIKIKWLGVFSRGLLGLALVTLLGACGKGGLFNQKLFRERAPETPPPSDTIVDKSFFVDPSGKPKTFLCGWAPEAEAGEFAHYFFLHLAHGSPHCNLEFEIREQMLVGKLVNPSYLGDRSRWIEAVQIPIESHFYYEKDRDQYGRETNRFIENTSRSHWSARPKMRLNLARTRLGALSDEFWNAWSWSTATDIEWDHDKGFLGFSLNMANGMFSQFAQAQLRVNFLKFDHDPSFKKVPFHESNARFMNVLHVMGRRHDMESELYAARWDQRHSQKLYINGVPNKQVEKLLVDAVEKWNQTFVEENIVPKGHKLFIPVVQERKHAFDLRYPGITWVQERRMSLNAPLGIGQAHADVRNGQILWGGVILWGGMLEALVNAYVPSPGSGDTSALEGFFPLQLAKQPIPDALAMPPMLNSITVSDRDAIIDGLTHHETQMWSQILSQANGTKAQKAQAEERLKLAQTAGRKMMAQIANDTLQVSRNLKHAHQGIFSHQNLIEMMGYKKLSSTELDRLSGVSIEDQHRLTDLFAKSKNPEARRQALKSFQPTASSYVNESGRTFAQLMPSWNASEARSIRPFSDMFEGVVMELTLHEIGHMVGLGHQFKENILPRKGSVPSSIAQQLEEKAKAEKGFTNASSVMGYKSGRTELFMDAKKSMPGPHDRLVVRYIYGGEYSVYDSKADQFVFVSVPQDGQIPDVTRRSGKELKVSYFPSCNDYEASLGADPYCNRWDRGSTAHEIVRNEFAELNDNLVSRLYSFANAGSVAPWEAEMAVWGRSIFQMSRVRLFYDEMRRRLATESHLKPIWDEIRKSENALYGFSAACEAQGPSEISEPSLRKLFFKDDGKTHNGEIRDLCLATKVALKEMGFVLSLPLSDYTKIDHKERYILGGYLAGDASRDISRIFGSWYQLTNLPLKYMALHTLTTSDPYLASMQPNPFFDTPANRYSYRSLFPFETTQIVNDMVINNIRFGSLGESEQTSMSRLMIGAAWMLNYGAELNNEALVLPATYMDSLRNAGSFQVSAAAVLINAIPPENKDENFKPNHYKKFTGTIYDWATDKVREARDVYVLPKGRVIVRANDTFLYPMTRIRFLSDSSAYVIALKVDFDSPAKERLSERSVKSGLLERHESVTQACVDGPNGLAAHFDIANKNFGGFYIPSGIAVESGKEKMSLFLDSLETEFKSYDESRPQSQSMLNLCEESLRGMGQVTAVSSLLGGYFLPIALEYLAK